MSSEIKTEGTELPVPPDFPVEWSEVHNPLPATPMSHSLSEVSSGAGMERVAKEAGRNTSGRQSLVVNGYSYYPVSTGDQGKEDDQAERERTDEAISTIRRRWDEEMLPALKRDLKHMAGVDLGSATNQGLLDILDEFLEMANEHWYVHFLVVFPMHSAADRMVKKYQEVMGEIPEDEPSRLLQGIDNMSMVVGRALQELAETARSTHDAAAAFESGKTGDEILAALKDTPEAQEFLDALDRFLAEHGYRPASFDSIYPSWIEDPSFVLLNVKSYLASPSKDLLAEQRNLAEEAGEYLDRVLTAIGNEEEKTEDFLKVYEQAKELWPLKEDHSYYIDQGSVACLRMVVAEMGRRLSQRGILDEPDDVDYLTLDEAREALVAEASKGLQDVVVPLKTERERFIRVVPPQYIGTAPPEGLPGGNGDTPGSEDPNVLRGSPGSRGIYTGPARIVRGPEEFHRVQPGDVLVCTARARPGRLCLASWVHW